MPATIIIGERLNSTNPKVKSILDSRDRDLLLKSANDQIEGGAVHIDINASMMMGNELDVLLWAGGEILESLDVGISVDSPDLSILLRCAVEFGGKCIINSLTCESETLRISLDKLSSAGSGLIIMLKNREGIPRSAAERLLLAEKSSEMIIEAGIEPGNVYFDPVFTPVATSEKGGLEVALETLQGLKDHFGDFRTVGGLSNISYGLPLRKLLNRTFLSMIVARGISALICDPTDRRLIETLLAAEALTGKDRGCKGFLKHYRSTKTGK